MSYLKAHIFVPFHCFVQVFFTKKEQCSVFTCVRLHYIAIYCQRATTLLIVSFRHYLFTMVFSKEDKIMIKNDYEKKVGLRIKFVKTIHSKTGLTHP